MYVQQQPKLSMYSNWQVQPAKEELCGLTPGQMIALYDSRQQQKSQDKTSTTTVATSKAALVSTHSSYWTFRQQEEERKKARELVDKLRASMEPASPAAAGDQTAAAPLPRLEPLAGEEDQDDTSKLGMEKDSLPDDHSVTTASVADNPSQDYESNDNLPEGDSEGSECGSSEESGCESQRSDQQVGTRGSSKRVRIFQGGFKSNEDYTYIRGRGRGKYVCEECGIRCKKPSMLKKHIRTHTDLRPYSCSHCSFAFKTKGNLTKHMKSKAHHKKCMELGIVPVPTVIDDSQIDEEALAKQVANRQQFLDAGDIDEEDEDDDEDFDEDDEEEDSEFDEEEEEGITNGTEIGNPESEPLKTEVSSEFVIKNQPEEQFEDAPACSSTYSTNTTTSAPHTSSNSSPYPIDQPSGQVRVSGLSQQKVQQIDQEAEAARSLLNLSDSWMAKTHTGADKCEDMSVSTDLASSVSSPSLVGISHSDWSSNEDQGPKSRPRSYSVNVPPSHNPHTKVISYALPAVTEESSTSTSRRYSMSALSESRRVLNSPSSSSMYSRVLGSSEKNQNAKDSDGYCKPWQMTNGGEQPMDLRVSKTPRLMVLVPQQVLWNSSNMLLSPVSERPTRTSSIGGSSYGSPFSEGVVSQPDYVSSLNANSYSPTGSGRVNVEVFSPKEPEELSSSNMVEASVSPEAPEYSALSPISPASVDGDSQACTPTIDEISAVTGVDCKMDMNARQFAFSRMNNAKMEEGKCVCSICNKTFSKPSQLRLHVNIHYFERPFRCESCAVSFRTKGHLQKHKRSVSHYNKVNMNMTFGTPTTDNPRPFKCGDCKIAFRIHGHLAKHLRSKMHIMKLECLGKLPFGMYAEMERSGINLNEIDTTDCENSLESLQVMAHRLYQQEPRRMRWQSEQQGSNSGKEDPVLQVASTLVSSHSSGDDALSSPPLHSRVALVSPPATSINHTTVESNPKAPLKVHEVKLESNEEEILRLVTRVQEDYGPPPSKMSATTDLSRVVTVVEKEVDIPLPGLHRSCTCHLCGRLFKSVKFLQVHLHCDHQTWGGPSASSLDLVTSVGTLEEPQPQQRWGTPVDYNQRLLGGSATVVDKLNCEICGKQFVSRNILQQHLLSHAQLRPFVCEVCDAGFTSSVMLSSHLASHSQEKPYMCHECGNTFAVAADFQRHMQAHLNDAT